VSARPAESRLRTGRPPASPAAAAAGTTPAPAAGGREGSRRSGGVGSLTTGIALIVGIVAAIIVVLLLLALGVYKYPTVLSRPAPASFHTRGSTIQRRSAVNTAERRSFLCTKTITAQSRWKRPPGKPNHTWLRATDSDLSIGPSYAWK